MLESKLSAVCCSAGQRLSSGPSLSSSTGVVDFEETVLG